MRLFVSLNADDFRVLHAARLFHGVIGVYVEKPERASLRDLPFELWRVYETDVLLSDVFWQLYVLGEWLCREV